jgi:hypothetical protein
MTRFALAALVLSTSSSAAASSRIYCYADGDGDGYAHTDARRATFIHPYDMGKTTDACPTGWAPVTGYCDDTDATLHPRRKAGTHTAFSSTTAYQGSLHPRGQRRSALVSCHTASSTRTSPGRATFDRPPPPTATHRAPLGAVGRSGTPIRRPRTRRFVSWIGVGPSVLQPHATRRDATRTRLPLGDPTCPWHRHV